jgi:hypothetical protein
MADEQVLEAIAEALLKEEAERQGRTLRSMGILSERTLRRIQKRERPLSTVLPEREEGDS